MKRSVLCILVLTLVFAASATLVPAQTPPVFKLGFEALADRIPDIVGVPVENEYFNLSNGNSEQHTTKGLMVWRKADNWTAYTNGYMTWINGPNGIQSRLNTDRFDWEAATPAAPAPSGSIPSFSHVFIIVMENKGYSEIIGSAEAPYINQLAGTYASATHYYAISHPSLPNYLALASGSTQGLIDDCSDCSFDVRNMVDQLEEHNKSWKAYMEDVPNPCFNGVSAGPVDSVGSLLYARKHNPWMYFKDISGNPQRCNQVVPLTQFTSDLQKNQLPDFVWITPNLVHDMHDGSIRDGDSWLASFVPQILDSAAWKDNGVLFVLWDEGQGDAGCCGDASGGQTLALVIAAKGKRAFQSEVDYTHYSVLRTIEEGWQLGILGGAGDPGTHPMADFFR